jgi:hypothetical protein
MLSFGPLLYLPSMCVHELDSVQRLRKRTGDNTCGPT